MVIKTTETLQQVGRVIKKVNFCKGKMEVSSEVAWAILSLINSGDLMLAQKKLVNVLNINGYEFSNLSNTQVTELFEKNKEVLVKEFPALVILQ